MTTTTTIRVPEGTITPDGIAGPELTVIFAAPDGTDLRARLRLFQYGSVFGAALYPTEVNGAVLRWHDGPAAEPRLIHWHAPQPGVTSGHR